MVSNKSARGNPITPASDAPSCAARLWRQNESGWHTSSAASGPSPARAESETAISTVCSSPPATAPLAPPCMVTNTSPTPPAAEEQEDRPAKRARSPSSRSGAVEGRARTWRKTPRPYLDLMCWGDPTQRSLPWPIIATRELRASASAMECVVSRSVRVASSRRSNSHSSILLTGSTPVEGSSRSTTEVPWQREQKIRRKCRSIL